MMAGATPSARAAALKLPRVATDTNDSKTLSLSMVSMCCVLVGGVAEFFDVFGAVAQAAEQALVVLAKTRR